MLSRASDCVIQGQAIPPGVLGVLRETHFDPNHGEALRKQLDEDGYLLLREVLNVHDVIAAREEVFKRLAEMGEIAEPARDGIATGTSRRRELAEDLGLFWQSVSEGPALRHVSHGHEPQAVLSTIIGEPARPHDYLFLRPSEVDRATHLHYDHPFFARGSDRILTVWTALGEIPITDGPLVVVEGSHRFRDLIEPILTIDYESNESPQVQLTQSTIELARQRKTRLLTADFHAGDLIVFTMTTLHGTLDNHSPIPVSLTLLDEQPSHRQCSIPRAGPSDRFVGRDTSESRQ